MKKITIISILTLLGVGVFIFNKSGDDVRLQHEAYLQNSPYKETLQLTKKQRRSMGMPPNKYFEREWELTMNPYKGKPTPENLVRIQRDIKEGKYEFKTALRSLPGDITNAWVERGPNNVGGRVKAVMFDPNDKTHETVFAGGVSGGLWVNHKISDPTSKWVQVPTTANISVTSIVSDPNNSKIIYIGSGESYTRGDAVGSGLWKSEDAGKTFTKVLGGIEGDVVFKSNAALVINTPSGIAGEYAAVKSSFDDKLVDIKADLVLVDDGSSSPTFACNELVNKTSVKGKIALIERGDCAFTDKIKNAQAAGAIAVVMVNNVAGQPFVMSGDDLDNQITIPSVMISQSIGKSIIQTLKSGSVNVTLSDRESLLNGVYLVPGKSHINDIITLDNNGVTEVFATVGDSYYSAASTPTLFGSDQIGVYKSVDSGKTWTKMFIPTLTDSTYYVPFDLEVTADNKLWMSTTSSPFNGAGGGAILLSNDLQKFELKHQIEGAARTELAVSKTDSTKFYMLCSMSSTSTNPVSIFKTEDAFKTVSELKTPVDGSSWVEANDFTNGQSWYDLAIVVDELDDDMVYVGGISWFRSNDGGVSWNQIAAGYPGGTGSSIHPDQHGINIVNSKFIVLGNDGGVVYSNDAGKTFEHRNNGLNITQFYSLDVAPTTALDGEYFVAGAQDNGTQLITNANNGINSSVNTDMGGDGAFCMFDQDGTDKYFIGNYIYNNYITLYNFETEQLYTINSESQPHGDFINQETLDSNLNYLYTNYSTSSEYAIKRYRLSLTGGYVLKKTLSDELLNAAPTALKVSPYTTESSTLLAGLQNGVVLKIKNANSTPEWSKISPDDMIGSISDIEFGVNESEIFVTIHNYGVKSVWYTNDGGQTWAEKEGNLPDLPVKCILQNPLRPEQVLIGTELGTWWTPNIKAVTPVWYHGISGGVNIVKVTDLVMRDDYKVYAATFGRGVFSSQFTQDDVTVGMADMKLDDSRNEINLYPNPVSDLLNIGLETNINNPRVYIYNVNGQLILTEDLKGISKNFKLNVEKLSCGIYSIKLKSNDKVYTAQFIKS